jgi:ferredoxin-NADP reductase
MPIRWNFLEYSPSLDQTGSWDEVKTKIDELKRGNVYCDYTVTKVEVESEVITSFYLEPEDGSGVACHNAGQFLPIEIQPPGATEPIRRTYTISNAPNSTYYRLSIKKEPAAQPGLPPGAASNYFHDHVIEGNTIRAMTPRGKFTLDESSTRPVVLLSGGVGVTPMISMLEQLADNSGGCGCTRQVWFIHGAINSEYHAFDRYVRTLATDYSCLNVHVRYSQPSDDDVEGKNFDSTGRVDIGLIKSLLLFDDYEFYMCGPPAFLESLYEGLKDLNVADNRIHYEFFGPGATLLREQPGQTIGLAEDLQDREPVLVRFAKSETQATWDPSKGTLLDLAESEGLRPAYSCRSGICQTCSTKITAGQVDYLETPMATPEAGEALICCSYPKLADGDDEVVLDI